MNKDYMQSFIDEKADGNKKHFTDFVEISYTGLLNFMNSDDPDKSLSTSTLKKIIQMYPDFDIRRFINEGSDIGLGMSEVNEDAHVYMPSIPLEYRNRTIPYVPVKARAGYLHSYADELFIESLQKVILPNFHGEHTNKRIFQVEGDSMYRTLVNDDLVIAEQVAPDHEVKENHIYVIASRTEGVVIKRVSDRTRERNVLILRSDNYAAGYSPMVIQTEDILEMWLAKGKITYDLGRDHRLEDDMMEMKNEVSILRNEINKLL